MVAYKNLVVAADIVQVVDIAVVELDIGVENIVVADVVVVVVVVPDIVVVVDMLAVVVDKPVVGVAGIGSNFRRTKKQN